jgi:hypothetical protein
MIPTTIGGPMPSDGITATLEAKLCYKGQRLSSSRSRGLTMHLAQLSLLPKCYHANAELQNAEDD